MVLMEEALEVQIPEVKEAKDFPKEEIRTMLQKEVVVDNKAATEVEDKEKEVVTTTDRTLTKATFNVTIARSMVTT